jgi:hypothetical protein
MVRKTYYFITIIILCVLQLTGCEKKPYDIRFERETINFGTVDAGTQVKVAFKFKNTGIETIEIKLVRPTCGCILPGDWDQTVESGKTGEIPVTYNTEVYEGEVQKVT